MGEIDTRKNGVLLHRQRVKLLFFRPASVRSIICAIFKCFGMLRPILDDLPFSLPRHSAIPRDGTFRRTACCE